ncbi:MAG: glycosyltransferase family 39 protein [Terriglobales bacterium]
MSAASTNSRSRTGLLLLIAGCGFLLFYGLGAFGLLGADEPRYAQVAREMLNRSDWVTPTLNGKPWLEKPPLYYWQAMLTYRAARTLLPTDQEGVGRAPSPANDGVSEQTARLPGALDAALMIAVIYFFLRRFRPGSELDGALITASCAGVIGFAHAASTDMPLAATFAIAMLAWFAFYERQRNFDLAIFYIFLALGTLAKGPVAPVLAAVIILLFAFAKRDWGVIFQTIWIRGFALFLAVALPWYVAVQMRNPEFFHVFILEHNLARFSSNIYHHPQPFWFYLPVFLLAVMPWTLWLMVAVVERVRAVLRDRRGAFASPDDSWALFLLLWMVVPVLFFSASQSKLPGYILPAVPAGALLLTEYLAARREAAGLSASLKRYPDTKPSFSDDCSGEHESRISLPLAAAHGILCGLMIFAALATASVALTHHLRLGKGTYVAATIASVFAFGIAAALVSRAGARLLRSVTMIAVVVSVAAVVRLAAPAIDATQSSRPVAEIIQAFSHEPVPVALYHAGRTQQYGLDFYLNRPTESYENGNIPAAAHVVVAAQGTQSQVAELVPGRRVSYLTSIPAQKLELYWVGK